MDEVVADIRQHGARKLIFVDLNLIADRGYALRLFAALVPLKLQWYGLSTVLLADDPEMLELAARSGCKGLLMGLESISPQNLRESRKGFNSPEKFARVVERLHEHSAKHHPEPTGDLAGKVLVDYNRNADTVAAHL